MCSIGWKRLEDGFLVFKNRDRYGHEDIKNRIIEDESVIGFGDNTFPGFWFGLNKKHSFAVLTAWGPKIEKQKGLDEDFVVVEQVLRESTNPESALKKFLALAEEKLGRAYNLIFADSQKAILLEWTPNKHSSYVLDGMATKTNDFVRLYEFNKNDPHALGSSMRRKRLEFLFSRAESHEQMKSMLAYHSETNEMENICRHDYAKTISSVFAYVKSDSIHLFYSLNQSPELRVYEEKVVSLG